METHKKFKKKKKAAMVGVKFVEFPIEKTEQQIETVTGLCFFFFFYSLSHCMEKRVSV